MEVEDDAEADDGVLLVVVVQDVHGEVPGRQVPRHLKACSPNTIELTTAAANPNA